MKRMLRWVAGALLLAALAGCRFGANALSQSTQDKFRKAYDEMAIASEPLCVKAGPFPFRGGSSRASCDRCQALADAGMLKRRVVDDAAGGYVEYALTPLGESAYRFEPDAAFVDLVRARFAKQGRNEQPNEKALSQPRMCFGTTRFHHIEEALPPLEIGATSALSVKVVAEVRDPAEALLDGRLAALGIPVPPKPAPGKPVLYPPRVMTLEFHVGDPEPEVSSMRYGKWVDEP